MMRKFGPVLLAIAAVAATGVRAADDQVASVAKGKALVERNCGGCHAVDAKGTSPNPNAPALRNLHQRMQVDDLGEGLAEGILTGHPAMPEFRFQSYEVVSIVMYLKAIQTKQTASRAPALLR